MCVCVVSKPRHMAVTRGEAYNISQKVKVLEANQALFFAMLAKVSRRGFACLSGN